MRTLLAYPSSTINELAQAVGINGISVRHHLTALEADDLIKSSEERHGVGRPRYIYSLSEKGIELFPTSYLRLTQRILKTLSNQLPPESLHAFFEEIGTEIAKPYENNLDAKTLDERLQIIKTALTNEGFIVDVEKNEDSFKLTNLSCPYYHIGLDHSVVCTIDYTVIARLSGTAIKVVSCMFDGSNKCIYTISTQSEVKND